MSSSRTLRSRTASYSSSSSSSSSSIERTLCLIKPNAFDKREEIVSVLEQAGFTVEKQRILTLSRAQIHRIYDHQFGSSFFDSLVDFLFSGPVVGIVLSKVDAVNELRHILGHSDPVIAKQVDPNSLRSIYGETIIKNGIHASRTKQAALNEIDCFFHKSPKHIILFGPPACGKGTQCSLLCDAFDLVHISTGDLLRQHVRDNTELGNKAKEYMNQGKLVPDDLITDITLHRLNQHDCVTRGWILDGFPRTSVQAQRLIDAGIFISRFVFLQADKRALISRTAGRRFDPETGNTYHITYNPPPLGPVSNRVIQRADDKEEVVKQRLDLYESTIPGVVKQFTRVHVVDSQQSIWQVFHAIIRGIDSVSDQNNRNDAIRQTSAIGRERLKAKL